MPREYITCPPVNLAGIWRSRYTSGVEDTKHNPAGDNQGHNRGRSAAFVLARWKPGQSGNPKGRPRTKTLPELIRQRLCRLAKDSPIALELVRRMQLSEDDTTMADLIVESLVLMAAGGNLPAIVEILNRLYGKPKDSVPVETDDGSRMEAVRRQLDAAAADPEFAAALEVIAQKMHAVGTRAAEGNKKTQDM